MEELGMRLDLHAVAADADGHVALQHDALGTGVVCCGLQLEVQVILDKILAPCIPYLAPRKNLQPPFILLEPRLELLRGQQLLATLGEDVGDVVALDAVDGLVVAIRQGVEFALLTAVGGHLLLVLQRT